MLNQNVETQNIIFPRLFKWCKLNTEHPYIVFGIGFSIHFFFLLFTIVAYLKENPIMFYFAFDDIPMVDSDYEPYQCYKVWNSLNTLSSYFGFDENFPHSYGVFLETSTFRFYYDSIYNNILIPETFVKIVELEEKLLNLFQNLKICLSCKSHSSTVDLISRTSKDKTFKNISETIDKLMLSPNYSVLIKDFSTDFKKNGDAYIAKSIKVDLIIFYLNDEKTKLILSNFTEFHKEYKSYFYLYMECNQLNGELLLNQIQKDIFLTIGSLLFIVFFTFIQTKSIFITIFGIGSMFTTFCISNFIHTIVFQIHFFGIFHVLSIFLILGLGCDNIYVFNDRWKSFENEIFESLAHRLYKTYTGVGWAMFITSITSAMAFCPLIITHLLTIFSFGTFVTILIVINYLSVLFYFPSVVVVQKIMFQNNNKPDKMFLLFSKFFGGYYFEFLKRKIVKFTILTMYGIIAIVTIIFVSRIRIAELFPQLMVSNSLPGRMETLKYSYYKKEDVDKNIDVVLMFGIDKLNYSICKNYDYKCRGKIDYDSKFEINSPGIQEEYMKLCNMLHNANSDLKKSLALYVDNENHISCLLKNMDEYFTNKYPKQGYTIPWTTTNFNSLVQTNKQFLNMTLPNSSYPSIFEMALIFFLTDDFSYSLTGKKIFYKNFPLCKLMSKINPIGSFPIYTMNFSAIKIQLTIYQKMSTYSEKKTIFNNWIKFAKENQNKFKVLVCGSQRDLSMNGYFHWIYIQHQLLVSALTGLISGIILAIPIVLLATRNVYTFLIIMLGTILSTITVASLITITGWDLGLLESINLTIIVGLSIDYLVHVGLAYNGCTKNTREEKTQVMLEEMGVSIVSGMLTTLGSASFLFFCQTKFLFQFGIFIFATILSAGIYSITFLPCFLLLVGPEFQRGKFHMFRKKNIL